MKSAEEILENLNNEFAKFKKHHNEELEDIKLAVKEAETIANRIHTGGGFSGHQHHDPKNTPENWIDKHGNSVPVFNSEQKVSGYCPQDGSGSFAAGSDEDYRNLSAGRLMAAMVSGSRGDSIVRNALSEGADSSGGVTVPETVMAQLIDQMRAASHVVNAGAKTAILTTEKTSIARLSSDPSAAWRLENGQVAESEPTFDAVQFVARSLAVWVPISRELIEDSINIETALQLALTGALAGEVDRVAMLGSGTAPEPKGIANDANINTLSMGENGAAITNYAQLLSAYQLMAEANSSAPTAAIMAPRTRFAYAGLVDSSGQPLNRPDIIKDLPLLMTTKVPIDDTQGTAVNASKIILGDFSRLILGVRSSLRIEILNQPLARNLQYAFLAHLRMDIAIEQPKAFTVIKGVIPA